MADTGEPARRTGDRDMRIGWHVPLPGPFSAGGTLWRSKRRRRSNQGGPGGCLVVLIATAAVTALAWPVMFLHGTARLVTMAAWLAVLVTGALITRRAGLRRTARTAAERETRVA